MPQDKNSHIIQTIASYGKSLLGFIRKRVKSDADAEDILQDVWYQFSNVVDVRPIEQTSDDEDDDAPNFAAILFTDATTPETEYLRNLFWEQLFLALDELPENQKQVFIWQELEDMPFEEIAKLTGENVNTLVSRKRYAVLHLRKRLKQLYKEITEY
jgi:DNA-directed RNA polymerase specialized sigma24 family protein